MSRRDGPPRLARALLEWLLPADDAGSATGDLDEEYARYVRPTRGWVRANLWYWRQVLLSAPRMLSRRRPSRAGVLGQVLSDVRFAGRVLRRRPGFTVATVGTIGLALAVNTTVFSVVNAVLVRPLPFTNVDRLVRPLPDALFFTNSAEAQRIAERMTSFEAFVPWGRTLFLFTGSDGAEEVRGARVGWNHFDVLGVTPLLGRTFVRDDALADDAIVLGHGLWERRFGGDPDIVGTTVDLYGRLVTVIGVLSPDHVPLEFDWEAWRAMPLDPARTEGMGLAATGLLRDGIGLQQSLDELKVVLPEIWAESGYVATPEDRAGIAMAPLRSWLVGDSRPALLVLSGAVLLVLLLGCANVSNLFITQSGARAREFAVRAALGGSRRRVASQLIVEVALISCLGGVVALALSTLSLGWFRATLPADLPRAAHVSISPAVVIFTVAITIAAALLTGLFPALRSSAGSLAGLQGRGEGTGRDRRRVRSLLVGAEMALAVILIVGAGLMVRTLTTLQSVDPGFEADGIVTFRPSPPSNRYPLGPELTAYYDRLTEELARSRGVTSVGAIQFLPMTPGGWWDSYRPEGRVFGDDENTPSVAMRVVRGAYFEAMRIPLLSGRTLGEADSEEDALPVAVVNRSFEAEAFPGESAVGREVVTSVGTLRVVGVVGNVHQSDLRSGSHAELYLPFGLSPWRRMHMVVRTDGASSDDLQAVAAAARAIDSDVALLGPRAMNDVVGGTIVSARLVATLLSLFGLVGLGIGAIGVYGVTAQTVAEQKREIGIRLALGADAAKVASKTVKDGLVPVAVGVTLGLVGALLGGRVLEGLLFGVEARDPGTFLTAPVLLLLVAILSLAVPARRATRVDPVRTLQAE